jgi:hypothetical protein
MALLAPRYTRAQRAAVVAAYNGTFATAAEVAALAANGELCGPCGTRLAGFRIPVNTIRSMARRHRLREAATRDESRLAALEPRDAIERMRLQLADVIEATFDKLEVEQAEDRMISGEVLRQLARAIREYAAIPGRREPLPPAPGAKVNGVRYGSETRGGIAGAALAALRQHHY